VGVDDVGVEDVVVIPPVVVAEVAGRQEWVDSLADVGGGRTPYDSMASRTASGRCLGSRIGESATAAALRRQASSSRTLYGQS